jgi:hypothetical protein
MNPEIKAQWVADLRSGEFKQGVGTLKSFDGRFCCLGVLMEQAVRSCITKPAYHYDNEEGNNYVYPFIDPHDNDWEREEEGVLTDQVQKWAGLTDDNPSVTVIDPHVGGEIVSALAELNDSGNYDFLDIAQLIEDQL